MSQLLIHDYRSQLNLMNKVSGSQRETIVREAFKDLLKAWGRQHKERKPKAPPIREKFDPYGFVDLREKSCRPTASRDHGDAWGRCGSLRR